MVGPADIVSVYTALFTQAAPQSHPPPLLHTPTFSAVRVLDHFKMMVLDGVDLNSTPSFDQHIHECLDLTLANYGA